MALIVIDPGHGGAHPAGGSTPLGVRGPAGTLEKDITLRLAQKLAARLGGQVELTRDADVNLPLAERAAIARRSGARIFLSLHANERASGRRGGEAWVHPDAGSSARRLAERLHGAIAAITGPGRGVQIGPMALLDARRLGGADACLLELDHLGDRVGEARLTDARALDRLAGALARALRRHLDGARLGRVKALLTPGEYGQALAHHLSIVVDDPAEEKTLVDLLRRSPTFVALVQRLEPKLVGEETAADQSISYTELEKGRVTAGPHKGKWRLLFAQYVETGDRFIPGTSPEAPINANVITVARRSSDGPGRGAWVEGLVHETLHLEAAVAGRSAAAGASLQQRADAFIADEIAVRRQTQAIMKEIVRGGPAALSGFTPDVPRLDRRDVERDFFPGDEPLTYLESFVFDHLLTEAIAQDGLSGSQVDDLARQSREESVGPGESDMLQNLGGFVLVFDRARNLYVEPATRTLAWLMRRRACSAHWKLRQADAPLDVDAVARKHAELFFPDEVQYTP